MLGKEHRMTIKQIYYLQEILKAGSISKAAESLYIAQSSLSAAIKEVEDEYKIVLFKRSAKGISLTRQGAEFMTDIHYISDFYQNLEEKYKPGLHERQSFCVAAHHHVIGQSAFEELVSHYSKTNYSFSYLEGNTEFIMDKVANNQADIGIFYFINSSRSNVLKEIAKRNISFRTISYSSCQMYVHNHHPLAHSKTVSYSQILKYPFATYDGAEPESRKYTNSLSQWNRSRHVIQITDRAEAYSLLMKTNAYLTGSGYLSPFEQSIGLVAIPVIDLEPVETCILQRNNTLLSEIAMKYCDLLLQA